MPRSLPTFEEREQLYPRIAELEISVQVKEYPGGYALYIRREDLRKALGDKIKRFNELFGAQTYVAEGLHPGDVEDVLERMASGKLQGTQLTMD